MRGMVVVGGGGREAARGLGVPAWGAGDVVKACPDWRLFSKRGGERPIIPETIDNFLF